MTPDDATRIRRCIDRISRSSAQLAVILRDGRLQRPTLEAAMERELEEIVAQVDSIRARLADANRDP